MPDLDDLLGRVKPQCARCKRTVDKLTVQRFSPMGRWGGRLDEAYQLQATCHGTQQGLIIDARQLKPSVIEAMEFFGATPPPPPGRRAGTSEDVVFTAEQLVALRQFLWCGQCRRFVGGEIVFVGNAEAGAIAKVGCHGDVRNVTLSAMNDAANGDRVTVFEAPDDDAFAEIPRRRSEIPVPIRKKAEPAKPVRVAVAGERYLDLDDE